MYLHNRQMTEECLYILFASAIYKSDLQLNWFIEKDHRGLWSLLTLESNDNFGTCIAHFANPSCYSSLEMMQCLDYKSLFDLFGGYLKIHSIPFHSNHPLTSTVGHWEHPLWSWEAAQSFNSALDSALFQRIASRLMKLNYIRGKDLVWMLQCYKYITGWWFLTSFLWLSIYWE